MTELLSLWWAWLAAAFGLAIVEILAPGFIFLGFAIGALAMAGIVAFALVPLSAAAKTALFAGLSLLAWIGLRAVFKSPTGSVKTFDHDINDH